jgi:SAM-dependent methyltransferase
MPRVDYDSIAHLYDEPGRDHAVDARLLAFLDERPDLGRDTVRVLDVGCGTGKLLVANRAALPAAVLLGLDRYRRMLRIAARRGSGVAWVQGDGARLPLLAGWADYATSQFSYQHIADREGFLREVYRVLRPNGRFVMMNIDPWSMPGWAIYQYFPEAFERDEYDFLPAEAFAERLAGVGFTGIRVERRHRTTREDLSGFLAYATDRYRASQLMAIADSAYQAGLDRIRQQLLAAGGDPVEIDSESCLVTVVGDRPVTS